MLRSCPSSSPLLREAYPTTRSSPSLLTARTPNFTSTVCSSSRTPYIPKLEPFSRSKFERGIKDPPLIEKCENELSEYCSTLEGDESYSCATLTLSFSCFRRLENLRCAVANAFSSIEEVIAKFAQLTPQERAKRKLESLEALKKTFKKLDHDVNIQEFLGTSSQTIEVLGVDDFDLEGVLQEGFLERIIPVLQRLGKKDDSRDESFDESAIR